MKKSETEPAGFAAQVAGARRAVGSPVAGMVPNEEQESILDAAVESGLRVLVVGAGAGTGKTATLKMLEQVLPGHGQYTAFNSSLVAESKAKFVRAACNTTHSLAFRAVGKLYQHRLGGNRMRSGQVARILGIQDFTVSIKDAGVPEQQPDGTSKPTDKLKKLPAEFLAGQVLVAIRKFCQSADHSIGTPHFRYIDGIDTPLASGVHGCDNNNRVREYLLTFAHRAWEDLCKVEGGQLPFNHDVYVKIWQLGRGDDRPIISADYILLDESQDTAPVFLDVIRQQTHALLVLVGDSNQSIYEWRGAVDAMKSFTDAPCRMLSQSYRFGQAVADVANAILATLEEPTDLVMRGMPTIPSRVAEVHNPRCYLYRTNAGAVGMVMAACKEGKKAHLIGGGADVVTWCQAAIDLKARRGTRHPELCCFDTWTEVVEYSRTDEGLDMRLMVKLVDEFGAQAIKNALQDMPEEKDANLVVSTAHKSKGREWDTVKLGPDFPLANRMQDSDKRLLYVAATRAKLTLDIADCPPFCGGYDKAWDEAGGESRWVPGLEVEYTQAMPTQEEQDAWVADKSSGKVNESKPAQVAPANDTTNGKTVTATPQFTWTRLGDNQWYVRGPKGLEVNTVVDVLRRNGTTCSVTLRSVARQFTDAWVYSVN